MGMKKLPAVALPYCQLVARNINTCPYEVRGWLGGAIGGGLVELSVCRVTNDSITTAQHATIAPRVGVHSRDSNLKRDTKYNNK